MDRYKKTYSKFPSGRTKKTKLDQAKEIEWARVVLSSSESENDTNENNNDDDDDDDEIDEIVRSPLQQKPLVSTPPRRSYVEEAYLVDRPSLDTLGYGRMLNDTIVHFYMNYLVQRAPFQRQEQIHLFNSFFFSKLKDLHLKSNKSKEETKQTVARWEKHVKIFDKDFLVIPICDHQHWTLVVVAFARNAPPDTDEPFVVKDTKQNGSKSAHKEPAILIFDSLGTHRLLYKFTDPIREIFLKLRWQIERPNEEPREFMTRALMRDISAKVPKQQNSYDCGVYLLHSFEKFLANPMHIYRSVLRGDDLSSELACDTISKRIDIKSLIPTPSQ